jgi:hypothetical protein
MFFAGELDKYLSRAGVPVLGGLERTRFWAQVRERVPQARELYGKRAHALLERSSAALRPRGGAGEDTLGVTYRALAAALLGAIAEVAQAEWVIDTSHFPLRARELQRTAGIDLHLILLVREPEPVVASITRLVNRQDVARRRVMTLKTNADLWLTHALSLAVFRTQPAGKRILVHYEDLVAAPEAVLAQILERFGADSALPDLEALETGRALAANRLISSERVSFKRSPARERPQRPLTVTSVLQRPWRAVFARLRPAAGRGSVQL